MKMFAQGISIASFTFIFELSIIYGTVLFIVVLFKEELSFLFKCIIRFIIVIALQRRSPKMPLTKVVSLCAQMTNFNGKED